MSIPLGNLHQTALKGSARFSDDTVLVLHRDRPQYGYVREPHHDYGGGCDEECGGYGEAQDDDGHDQRESAHDEAHLPHEHRHGYVREHRGHERDDEDDDGYGCGVRLRPLPPTGTCRFRSSSAPAPTGFRSRVPAALGTVLDAAPFQEDSPLRFADTVPAVAP